MLLFSLEAIIVLSIIYIMIIIIIMREIRRRGEKTAMQCIL